MKMFPVVPLAALNWLNLVQKGSSWLNQDESG